VKNNTNGTDNATKFSVPFRLNPKDGFDVDFALGEMKRLRVTRAMLTLVYIEDFEGAEEEITRVLPRFKAEGYEVFVWFCTLIAYDYSDKPFTRVVAVDGKTEAGSVCPLDEGWKVFFGGLVRRIVSTGVDGIMTDDDFRIGTVKAGCFCENHMKRYRAILGGNVTREDFEKNLLIGKPDKYREAWTKVSGDTMRALAVWLRKVIDEVNPQCRCAYCSPAVSWNGMSGVSAAEMAKILAGGTKPLMRLMGAPYTSCIMQLPEATLIDFERIQAAEYAAENIEMMKENDPYPRDIWGACPTSLVEGFETALMADGMIKSSHKYFFDYDLPLNSGSAYADAHAAHLGLYGKIDKFFGEGESVGIRVYENWDFLSKEEFPQRVENARQLNFLASTYFFAAISVPAVFSGDAPMVVFGSGNAALLPKARAGEGLILDYPAARTLQERGIDVGLIEDLGIFSDRVLSGKKATALGREWYLAENRYSSVNEAPFYRFTVSDKAEKLTEIEVQNARFTGAYRYQNAAGQKFSVLPYRAYDVKDTKGVFRCFERQRQVLSDYVWFTGRSLPAVCRNHPNVYLVIKQNGNALTVGVWNFSRDGADLTVELSKAYDKLEIIEGKCTLKGDKVLIHGLAAHEFCGFRVTGNAK
jgi:hypothetical protein